MPVDKPRVLIVGSGGVGVICALSLVINKKSDVTLVVRSDYEFVSKNGYTIKSKCYGNFNNWKPHNLARSVTEAFVKFGEFDFILLTTKNIPDGTSNCEDIFEPAVTDKTTIVLIQNGIGIDKPMLEKFPNNILLSGVSLIGSTNINCVIDNSHKDQIFIGPFNNPNIENYQKRANEIIKQFFDIYQNAEESRNKIMIDDYVEKTRWEKLVYNSVFNTTTAIVNLDANRCQINNANETIFRPAMKEIIKIAASEGYEISEEIPEKFIHIGDGLFYTPSMCVDMRKKQLLELEVILGNPLRIAAKNGISTPILSLLYNLLVMVQFRIKEEIGLIKVDESKYRGNSDDYPTIFANSN